MIMNPVPRSGLAVALLLLAASAEATTLRALDTRSLTRESSDIVIGAVTGVRSYWNDAHTRILTDVSVDVRETLAGGTATRLTLTQYGGEVDGVRVSVPGAPLFVPGEEALLFVWRDATGRAQVNGLAQGKFDIERDAATGERLVQRGVPGFAVRDVRTLRPLRQQEAAPRLRLDDLVREIHAALREADR